MAEGTRIRAESGFRYAQKAELVVWSCCTCGILYAVPDSFDDRRRKDGRSFYCPNGHSQAYSESEADRLRKKLEREEKRSARLVSELDQETAALRHERNSARALKGHLTRMRRRIANGVCPVPECRRSGFAQVVRHIKAKHPEWHAEHAHEIVVPPPG